MGTRVADRTIGRNYLKYMYKAKNDYSETNAKIASGNRFTQLSDDVSAGTQVLKARTEKYKVEKQLKNVDSALHELTTTESTMTSISTILTRVHELAIEIGNDPTGDGRLADKTELKSLRDEILKYANVKIGSKYLLGGTASSKEPFTLNESGELMYNNIPVDQIVYDKGTGQYLYESEPIPNNDQMFIDAGLNFAMIGSDVQSDTAIQVSYCGLDVLGCGTDDKGLSNNVFNLLNQMIDGIKDDGTIDRELFEAADSKLYDEVMDTFRQNITDIGTKTKYMENIKDRLALSVDNFKLKIDNLMGISEEEESINLAQQDATYKAVLQIGANILPLTLMDYIR